MAKRKRKVRNRGPGPPVSAFPAFSASSWGSRFSVLTADDGMVSSSPVEDLPNNLPPSKKPAKRPRGRALSSQQGCPVILSGGAVRLGHLSPKVLQPLLQQVCGTASFLTRSLKGGDLLVSDISPECSRLLLGLTMLGCWPVSASVPASLRVRGLLRDVPADLTAEDLLAELSDQGVMRVSYLCARQHSEHADPSHLHCVLLDFASPHLPDVVCCFSRAFRVEPYRVRALMCYRCQGFGHSSKFCRNRVRCGKCCGSHLHSACETPQVRPLCVNCRGAHFASSSDCPVRRQAVAVSRAASRTRCSYAEALRVVRAVKPPAPPVAAFRPRVCHRSTQVDFEDLADSDDTDMEDSDAPPGMMWVRHVGLQTPFFLGHPALRPPLRTFSSQAGYEQVLSQITEADIVQMVDFLRANADKIVRHIRARDCKEDWVQLARFFTAASL